MSGPIIPDMTGNRSFDEGVADPFDPKTAYEGAFAHPEDFNRQFKLLWLGIGTAEPPVFHGVTKAANALKAAGVKVVYFESQGTAHEWQTWRRDLNDLAPRLFR